MSERTAVAAGMPAPQNRAVRARDGARTALAALDEHDSIAVLTFGQFSIGDAIRELLRRSGPSDVAISTWTAARAEIEHAYRLLEDSRIRSMRWLVDRSFKTRQPAYCAALVDRFGADAIRTTRTHAKFVVIDGDNDTFSVHTSANLNANARLESMQVIRGRDHADWLLGVLDDLWRELPAGEMAGELPDRTALDDAPATVRVGRVPAIGPVAA